MGRNRDNPWLSQLLTGAWSASAVTPDRAARVELRLGDVVRVLEGMPDGSLDGITLSNVLDGPGPDYAARMLAAADRAARVGAPIIVRSFLDDRDPEARRRADRDRSLMWGGVTVRRAGGERS